MMTTLSIYRAGLDALLATAVDSATWPNALKDEALLRGLGDFNAVLVYETSMTLATPGREQDVSLVVALDEVLAVAWPWHSGADFATKGVHWRGVGPHRLYLETRGEPQAGDVLRLRHTMLHTIDELDGATQTTVPDRYRLLVTLAAAIWAIDLRLRQISENPALPATAAPVLRQLQEGLHQRYAAQLGRVLNRQPVRWEMLDG